MKQAILNDVINKYRVQPVGDGFIDCIIVENSVDFVKSLSRIGVRVAHISFWCHCTEKHVELYGCPHGMGGPRSKYYDGWFSEMNHIPLIDFDNNEQVVEYLTNHLKHEEFYTPCLVPGLWLDV